MFPACVAVLAALAAEPGRPGGALVAGPVRPALEQELLQALPPAPETAVRVTKRYGTVTIDHRRHLEVRASCRGCHGQGVVSKITFTPQLAHERCIGCHRQRTRGPTDCAACHVRTLPSTPSLQVVQPSETKPAPASASPPTAEPAGAAVAAAPAPAVELASGGAAPTLEVGCAAGPGFGPALKVTSRHHAFVGSYSFERLDDAHAARMLVLLGFGLWRPVHERVALHALGVGGLDAEERPRLGVLPAVGARASVEWRPPRAWLFRTVNLSVTGLADVPLARAFGHHSGGARVFVTLATGVALPPGEERRAGPRLR